MTGLCNAICEPMFEGIAAEHPSRTRSKYQIANLVMAFAEPGPQ
jgi:hypothetical protein